MPDEWPMVLCRGLSIAMLLATPVAAQDQALNRTTVLRAEDARGKGPEGMKPILDALQAPALRELAIRALGRLERPQYVATILPYLNNPELTATTAEALAQALQGLRDDTTTVARRRFLVDSVSRAMRQRVVSEPNGAVRGVLARSLGRLPYDDSVQARQAESVVLRLAPLELDKPDDYPAGEGVAHALYSLARARRALGPLSPEGVAWLRAAIRFGHDLQETARIRRLGWLALAANGLVTAEDVQATLSGSRDAQVRRLAIAALPNVADSAVVRAELERVRRDPDWLVRLEWLRVYRQRLAATDCRPLLEALSDSVHHVRLAAIDALGGPCSERDTVMAVLRGLAERRQSSMASRQAIGVSWHDKARALLALARVDSVASRPLLGASVRDPVWQVRMYVARAAAAARDTAVLSQLAFDRTGSVREVAIQGLAAISGHVADLVYTRALRSPDYHVVLAAARALRGAPVRDAVLPEILGALDRLTKERRQTSRDPRMELLARVQELGTAREATRLTVLLRDHDELIARTAASVIGRLTGTVPPIAPDSGVRPIVPASGAVRVRVTMAASSGGGAFEMLLDGDRAPLTVSRIVSLIRRQYYDGLTFHRVIPNFVLQGGSPGMNEYVGDGPFMRDELGLAHHVRGTVGISTRGRDTGDAQWFINMVDNYRLDHEYTVFATIVDGMDVVDRILEGDVMASVRLIVP